MKKSLLVCVLIGWSCFAKAQPYPQYKAPVYAYIDKYKGIAVSEMKRTNIPASIKLAQGILESASGNSFLAREANNHFGIKCHRSWRGNTLYAQDDKPKECFRKYRNEYASFVDHSNFLVNNSRYSFLFNNHVVDYHTWARGLKEAGYASNDEYAMRLINLIEEYQLYQFDLFLQKTECGDVILAMTSYHNGAKTVMFNCDVPLDHIASAYNVPIELLKRYNNVPADDIVLADNMVFLEPPQNRTVWQTPPRRDMNYTVQNQMQNYGIAAPATYAVSKTQPNAAPPSYNHPQPMQQQVANNQQRQQQRPNPYYQYPVQNNRQVVQRSTPPPKSQSIQYPQQSNWVAANYMPSPVPQKGYIVQAGDTLYSLSRRFGVPIAMIKTVNNLQSNMIRVGQSLQF